MICTKDRPEDLRRCLESLLGQTRPPEMVRIVDASSTAESSAVAAKMGQRGLPIWYRRSSPSTTRQRNLGVDAGTSAVVHFLDDDVELDPPYLDAILRVFEDGRNHRVGGVGGIPRNLPPFRPSLVRRLIRPESCRQGAVLPSGRGVLVYTADGLLDVDWLSGCCMSFRREVFALERFDDRASGYVLGEDLDFSYRVRQHFRLLVSPEATLLHHESPTNRLDAKAWGERDVLARFARVDTRVGSYRKSSFLVDTAAQIALHAARSTRTGRRERELAVGMAKGLLRAVRPALPAPVQRRTG